MPYCPTLVIAGTQSSSGKTSLTLALARALARRDLRVQTFKAGPDFLDPTYLALASGRPCYNLDGWMTGQSHVRGLFNRAVKDADVALVEGVMGLFDGADAATDEGSTAEIARWLDAPVLLIANVHGMGRSIAALVKGFTGFAADLRFAGVVANHCGSASHAALLADSLKASGLPPLVGAIPRGAFPELASRHLGLVTADRGRLPEALLDALADVLESRLLLGALFPELQVRIGKPTRSPGPAEKRDEAAGIPADTPAGQPHEGMFTRPLCGIDTAVPQAPSAAAGKKEPERPPARLKIGVARDAAFHFYYQDIFDALTATGCETLFFSPLADRRLPAGISGLYIGGGYPEAHARTLAANGGMLAAIRAYAATGRPLYAECGGLMYLSQGIEAEEGFFPFLGILPARTRMLAGKKALGYVEITLTADSLWGRRGEVFRGHEFHYSELIGNPTADAAWRTVYALRRRRSGTIEAEGFQKGAILASYTHLAYASHPAAIEHFLQQCGGTP
ncbi:MAG: cobyrinate a,c-diamide synthase [Syntrophales bacterium]